MRSIVFTKLSNFIAKNPHLHIELNSQELSELPDLLESGSVDYILTYGRAKQDGLAHHFVGIEENVLVESRKPSKATHDIYLDHDSEDRTTELFWSRQRSAPKTYRRRFLDDIYGIIDGVENGWGRAIIPKHLIRSNRKIRQVRGLRPLRSEVYLHYFERPFDSPLHQQILDLIRF